ncbi:MAG TPA: alpha/beta hydrolase [Acetobacteraceae bacterium]|nr:alpha/beta hydrolase [Acetobacteraceae bacterium]
MIPVYLSGCFGMLHPGRSRRGVLICGSLSDEALNAYRPLAFLAEQLAAADFPTLRLSYYGTGDSAGEDSEPERFAQWLDSIKAGMAWLCAHGVDAVTLVGHRIGASLAARVACETDTADSLVLLSPVSGRHFLHEMTLAARISQRVWQTSHKVDDGTWFEAHGLRMDHATRDALSALDLRKLPRQPARQALLLQPEIRAATQQVVDTLQRLGTDTVVEPFEDLASLMRDSHQAEVPAAAFARVAQWVRSLPAMAGARIAPEMAGDASLDVGVASEMPIYFGIHTELFGILSMPVRPAPEAPAMLVVNTSANPRWGNARIAVDLARGLAADGVAVLRMDASGMGDSAPHTGDLGRPYAETLTRDVMSAVAELNRRTGQRVAVLGVCSGAYHALQAAPRDQRIAGLVLVNLQRFAWRDGDVPDAIRRTDLRPTRFYLRQIFSVDAWRRLLRADFDVLNLARVLGLRLLRRTIAGIDPLLALVFRGATRVGRVRQMARTLGQRGVRILYVLGCNDPGVEELAEYFGHEGWRLRKQPHVTLRSLADADHTLGAARVRAELIGQIRNWLSDAWPAMQQVERSVERVKPSAATDTRPALSVVARHAPTGPSDVHLDETAPHHAATSWPGLIRASTFGRWRHITRTAPSHFG